MVDINLPDMLKKKTTGFLFLGILLFLGSSYINTLKTGSADFGIYTSIVIIFISIFAQFINWLKFWRKK